MGDLIVFDDNPSEHGASIRSMFERLWKRNLKLTPPKATIGSTGSKYCGTHNLARRRSAEQRQGRGTNEDADAQ